jgi:hypothetical protein
LSGGKGADYFDCGASADTVADFNVSEGDMIKSNCEKAGSLNLTK